MDLGNQLLAKGEFPQALIHFTNIIQFANPPPQAFFARATAFIKLDDFESAKLDLQKALELDSNSIQIICQLAYVYLHQGNSLDALKLYVSVVNLDTIPKFKALLNNSIQLTVNRAKAQGYTDNEINSVYTDGIKQIVSTWETYKPTQQQQQREQDQQPNIIQIDTPTSIRVSPNVTTHVSTDQNGTRRTTTTTTTTSSSSSPTTGSQTFDLSAILNNHRQALNNPNNPLNSVINVGSNIASAVDILRNSVSSQNNNAPTTTNNNTSPLEDPFNESNMDLD